MRPPLFQPQHVLSKVGTRVIVHAMAPLAARWPTSMANPRSSEPSGHEPVFILGPPRCGSTILYQALTNYFDVVYIDNLAARWAAALPYGFTRSMRRFGKAPHDNFGATHGDTSEAGGWHAPSECGNLWYRWIPFDQHYVAPEEVTEDMVRSLRNEFEAIQTRWDAPLVIKNLHVGQRLAWITAAFPRARYVCIHRDPEEVTASILRARRRLGVPPHELWSTRPPVSADLTQLPEEDMVRHQIARLTSKLEDDLLSLPTGAVHHVRYEDFSHETVRGLGQALGFGRRPGGSLPDFGVGA